MNDSPSWPRALVLVPVVGASDSLINALILWLAWVVISFAHGSTMALLRPRLTACQQLIASIAVAAAMTACADLLAQAWILERHGALAVYIGWIALSCVALEHTATERRMTVHLRLAGQFGLLVIILGALRELIGRGVPLALIVPGGFILLGLLLAAYQALIGTKTRSTLEETPRP
ncbi:Rnf-Nqr domain containing protein [Pseudomonas frederiksbergensis]|uniref:Rnf-Nqr domain containing protein n=1 Tax=Pseudomonas frederiksbergensis TaxID=104087 RepID=UPI002DB5B4B8|nr:Rnf-Nqr domain containing protein [Pseudomonas frederiksbergensis]WRV69643.1 Rnf-Nqr domain containing protein [Pseudomonas frederiksbergensis]